MGMVQHHFGYTACKKIIFSKKNDTEMKRALSRNFYEVQSLQWQKSLFLFVILIVFYFLAVGLVSFVFLLFFGLLFSLAVFPGGSTLVKFLIGNSAVAVLIAAFHFYDARASGARFIRKHLGIQSPDSSDRYHRMFVNTVEEMRIAAGLPKVNPFIYPTFAINSMALIEPDKTPSIIVTEGLLAEFTRDEVEAVVAHEIAHIVRGDTFYVTLVCSLANFFERIRDAIEPEEAPQGSNSKGQGGGGGYFFVYAALTISTILMHLLSTLISRERETLADAAAVELCRNPRALARAIYKAHVKNSFVGDFNRTYSPLLIVPPESKATEEGFFSRLFNSHPPLMKRIRLLSQMVPVRPAEIIEEVHEIHKTREKTQEILFSQEETLKGKEAGSQEPLTEKSAPEEGKVWAVRSPHGKLLGPYALEEVLFLQFFTPLIRMKNLQEEIEAPARDFPQVRRALQNILRNKPVNPNRYNRCPRCQAVLLDGFYEGVSIKTCPKCQGKLVGSELMDRIVVRKEVAFSKDLQKKARDFRENFMDNPVLIKKISTAETDPAYCPNCGSKMFPRPYNYQYIIPVEKCLSCHKIWFDADELEILQILIEDRGSV